MTKTKQYSEHLYMNYASDNENCQKGR